MYHVISIITGIYRCIYHKNRYVPWYVPLYIPWYILLQVVGNPDPLLCHGIYHGIYRFFGIYHGIYRSQSVIYHGISGFDPFLRHGTYQFFGYMARYVSIFWVHSSAQDGMYWGEGGIYLWYIAKVVYTV